MILFLLLQIAFTLELGAKLPAVTALDESGKTIELSQFTNEKYVLVYFYPKADTPGCTAQASSLRDAYADLQTAGVKVFGVSTDTVEDQAAFKKKYNLPFSLLADEKQDIAKAFDVSVKMGFASRQAFLFEHGKLVWLDHQASTSEQAKDVLNYIGSKKR